MYLPLLLRVKNQKQQKNPCQKVSRILGIPLIRLPHQKPLSGDCAKNKKPK